MPHWQVFSVALCFLHCGHVARAGEIVMSFMPMQHAKKIICHRFWTRDQLHKHMRVHLLTHARPRHPKGSWWLPSPSVCVNGVSFLLSCPPTTEAYVSQFIAHPCSKSCGGDVFTLFAIHFVV
jgi:hypothetical protein